MVLGGEGCSVMRVGFEGGGPDSWRVPISGHPSSHLVPRNFQRMFSPYL